MTKKITFIHIFFFIITLLIKWYHLSGPDLVWNMFLALVALDFAFLTYYFKNNILKLLSGLIWLFFYPNTFYMLTDIVHIHFTATILSDRTSMIYYILYMSSILFGVMCGLTSIQVLFKTYTIKRYELRLLFLSVLSFVSSFAIHIGRYARLNSWDIVTKPQVVVHELLEVLNWNAVPFVLGFTFLQILCLVFLENEK